MSFRFDIVDIAISNHQRGHQARDHNTSVTVFPSSTVFFVVTLPVPSNLIFFGIPFRSIPNFGMNYSETHGILGKEHFFPEEWRQPFLVYSTEFFRNGIRMATLVVSYWMGSV